MLKVYCFNTVILNSEVTCYVCVTVPLLIFEVFWSYSFIHSFINPNLRQSSYTFLLLLLWRYTHLNHHPLISRMKRETFVTTPILCATMKLVTWIIKYFVLNRLNGFRVVVFLISVNLHICWGFSYTWKLYVWFEEMPSPIVISFFKKKKRKKEKQNQFLPPTHESTGNGFM